MDTRLARRVGGRSLLLGAVVVALTATGLLAVAILLFGDFGDTEGRILGTTALVAGYGLLALPAGFLVDQGRLRALTASLLGLAVAGFMLVEAVVWTPDPPAAVGKSAATVTIFALAASQTAALAARRGRMTAAIRRLFAVSVALVLVVAAMVTVLAWAELDSSGYGRVLGAVAVLDVLAVALQPILALGRGRATVYSLRVAVEGDGQVSTTVEAADFAAAAAKAIRKVERSGRRAVGVAR